MNQSADVPFGDDLGLDVLDALRELGEGLSRLTDLEYISTTGQPASESKQFDILQSVNRSIATSRWSQQRQKEQEINEKTNNRSRYQHQNILINKSRSYCETDNFIENDGTVTLPGSESPLEDSSEKIGEITVSDSDYPINQTLSERVNNEDGNLFTPERDGQNHDDEDRRDLRPLDEGNDFSVEGSNASSNSNRDNGDNRDQIEEEEEEDNDNDNDSNDIVEDEWDNDDDLGYMIVKISEQEFFEIEEECQFRQSLAQTQQEEHRVARNKNSAMERDNIFHQDNDKVPSGPSNLDDYDDRDHDSTGDDNYVNKSKRQPRRGVGEESFSMNMFSFPDDEEDEDGQRVMRPPPSPPPEDQLDREEVLSEKSEEDETPSGVDDDNDKDSLDDDIALVEREMGIVFKTSQQIENGSDEDNNVEVEGKQLNSVDSMTELPLLDIQDQYESVTVNNNKTKMSRLSRRVSEIMGQKKIRGVDGEHCYFDLKVIFDPYRTGFEEDKHFNPPVGTIVAGRYEVVEVLGQAAFSTALQCIDLTVNENDYNEERGAGSGDVNNQWVCLKVIKNSKDFFDQSLDEIKLLQYINSKGNPDEHNVLQMIDYFYCKEHLFIVSELLRENLYEFQKYIRESGGVEYFTQNRLKKIMKQILEALVYIHSLNLLHCDIKPENIVIKSYSRCEVKLIDFGSSCFVTDHLTTYIQSRSYRAPEVILGLPYDYRIDIWSLGGVLAEMHTAYVLFQNDSIATMLCRIESILGPYPAYMMEAGSESHKYFNLSGVIYERNEDDGTVALIYPKKTTLRSRLHLPPVGKASQNDELFLDFVNLLLQVDPSKRPTAAQALLHPWLDGTDDLDVAYNIEDASAPPLPTEEYEEYESQQRVVVEDFESEGYHYEHEVEEEVEGFDNDNDDGDSERD